MDLWNKAKDLVKGKLVTVDEMWTYRNTGAFYKWAFTCYVYTSLGFYSVGDRDENAFSEVKSYLPEGGRWVSDGLLLVKNGNLAG